MCCTSLPRVSPVVVRGLKFWAVQNFLPRPTPFRFFSASCHVYKSTVARLKLDINANNIVCFTGDHFLTGFGRDQAVKRCVTGPLYRWIFLRQSFCFSQRIHYATISQELSGATTKPIFGIWQTPKTSRMKKFHIYQVRYKRPDNAIGKHLN